MMNLQDIYYRTRLATVRTSVIEDVYELAKNMRKSDVEEIWKASNLLPENALLNGYTNSLICLTVVRKERPIAMFGIVPYQILGTQAFIWLLASKEIEEIPKTFLRHSKRFIDLMLEYYPFLFNYVDIQNRVSVRWLRWCGAEFGRTIPYGKEQCPFQYFQFRRKSNVRSS